MMKKPIGKNGITNGGERERERERWRQPHNQCGLL